MYLCVFNEIKRKNSKLLSKISAVDETTGIQYNVIIIVNTNIEKLYQNQYLPINVRRGKVFSTLYFNKLIFQNLYLTAN